MPPWIRAARADEIANGYFKFLNTDVVYGDNGIRGLRHYVPMAQSGWTHDGTANHAVTDTLDAATSRLMSRITASAGGAITSRMRKGILLPRDFGSFYPSGFSMLVRGSATLPTAVTMTIKRLGTSDGTFADYSILPAVGNTFEIKTGSLTTTTYLEGDFLLVEFKLTTANNGEWAEIGAMAMGYKNKRGNV